jgi:hypothetical protein
MKNKITCLLAGAALFGATANAEIALADGLSAYGYIDINAADTDQAGADGERTFESTEFELGLSFAPAESAWTATAELSYTVNPDTVTDLAGNTATDETSLETVAVTYQYSDALSFTFGRVYTYMGLESHDAPDNYFISYAGRGSSDLYSADFADGVCVDYSAGDISLGIWTDAISGSSFEYYAAYTGIDSLTLAVALTDNEIAGANNSGTTNIMATYELGDFTIMAENVDSTDYAANNDNLDITSITVAYSMGDTTFAVRAVDGEYGATGNTTDYEKVSVSAFHALSDNVAVGIEYSDEEFGVLPADDISGFGVELLYVF